MEKFTFSTLASQATQPGVYLEGAANYSRSIEDRHYKLLAVCLLLHLQVMSIVLVDSLKVYPEVSFIGSSVGSALKLHCC